MLILAFEPHENQTSPVFESRLLMEQERQNQSRQNQSRQNQSGYFV